MLNASPDECDCAPSPAEARAFWPTTPISRRAAFTVGALGVATLGAFGIPAAPAFGADQGPQRPVPRLDEEPLPRAVPHPNRPSTDRYWPIDLYDIDKASSLTVVLNKRRPLAPKNYVPKKLVKPKGIRNVFGHPLRTEAARALEKMHKAAKAKGVNLTLVSGYRSYDLQVYLFNQSLRNVGRVATEKHFARPGYSEHQTGLAVDLDDGRGCSGRSCFEKTKGGKWLKANAWRYGFILRYPKGQKKVHGYKFEPWHYRYVGVEIATDMHEQGVKNLEDYFGLPPAPDYKK